MITTYLGTRRLSVDELWTIWRCVGRRLGRLARGLRGVLELLQFPHRVRQVQLADDVVAVEHAAGLVSANSHRYALLHARADEISDRRPAKVVEDPSG